MKVTIKNEGTSGVVCKYGDTTASIKAGETLAVDKALTVAFSAEAAFKVSVKNEGGADVLYKYGSSTAFIGAGESSTIDQAKTAELYDITTMSDEEISAALSSAAVSSVEDKDFMGSLYTTVKKKF
ncbi:hypothetical protein [Ralstonia insidiosa]|uniref:hypothetical protein n=1 Tax=Ralstonia insidiosa TaxID=190721 RepID=UPI000CEE4A93|nr:hypothetical protein [Ralstonia insidiosa]